MGFFQGLGRVLQGKPVFDESDNSITGQSTASAASAHTSEHASQDHPGGIIKNTPSTFPIVQIEDFNVNQDGHEVDIRGWVKNEWHQAVIVQTVKAFGKQQQPGVWLHPEQAKEILLYKGPTFTRQVGYELLVDYKTEHEGDYFEAIHDVRYTYNSYEKTYEVSTIQLRMPIRDIYG